MKIRNLSTLGAVALVGIIAAILGCQGNPPPAQPAPQLPPVGYFENGSTADRDYFTVGPCTSPMLFWITDLAVNGTQVTVEMKDIMDPSQDVPESPYVMGPDPLPPPGQSPMITLPAGVTCYIYPMWPDNSSLPAQMNYYFGSVLASSYVLPNSINHSAHYGQPPPAPATPLPCSISIKISSEVSDSTKNFMEPPGYLPGDAYYIPFRPNFSRTAFVKQSKASAMATRKSHDTKHPVPQKKRMN